MIVHSKIPDTAPDHQTAAWLGIVDGHLLLVRNYADGSTTAAIKQDDRWGPEVELVAEVVES